ncbi:hypothetical protein [Lacinutrix chionoecetis]
MSTLEQYAKIIIKNSEDFLEVSKEISIFSEDKLHLLPNHFDDIVNLCMLCCTGNLELAINLKNATKAESEYEERYLIKQLYLIVYELSTTLDKNSKSINNLRNNDNFIVLHKKFNKEFKAFKKEYSYQNELPKFRNNAVAHFKPDIRYYHKLIDDMCIDKSLEMAQSFMTVLSSLQNALTHYFNNVIKNNTSNKKSKIDFAKMSQTESLQVLKDLNKGVFPYKLSN